MAQVAPGIPGATFAISAVITCAIRGPWPAIGCAPRCTCNRVSRGYLDPSIFVLTCDV